MSAILNTQLGLGFVADGPQATTGNLFRLRRVHDVLLVCRYLPERDRVELLKRLRETVLHYHATLVETDALCTRNAFGLVTVHPGQEADCPGLEQTLALLSEFPDVALSHLDTVCGNILQNTYRSIRGRLAWPLDIVTDPMTGRHHFRLMEHIGASHY